MKKALSSVIAAFVLFAAATVAKTSSSLPDTTGGQGTQNASPSQTSPTYSATTPPSQGSSSQSTGMSSPTPQDLSGAGNQGNSMKNDSGVKNDNGMKRDSGMKGDKRLKGCVQFSGGQYVLEEKKGRMVNLNSSQDLFAHVGHMVALHGHWGAKSSSDMSSSSPGSAAATNHMFYVDSVDMISDSCNNSKGKHTSASKDPSKSGNPPQHD